MDLWLMKEGIYGPTKRLVKTIECLAKFIDREGTDKPIVDFLSVARSELANHGWPMDERDEVNPYWIIYLFYIIHNNHQVKYAWGIFYGTFGFHHPTGLYRSFHAMVQTLFPVAKRQPVINFTLADLQRCDINVKATNIMHDYLQIRGDHVLVYILDQRSSVVLRSFHDNIIAK